MVGFVIWIVGLVLTIKAALEIWRIHAPIERRLIAIILIVLTSWIGLLFYYFYGKARMPQWLYFEEGPMFIGQDVPLDQPVPLQTIQQAVELMARDAAGTNKTLLQLVAGQAGEQDTAEKVRALEEKLREREAELAEERRLNRRLTAKLLLEGNAEEGSGQNTGNEAASGQ